MKYSQRHLLRGMLLAALCSASLAQAQAPYIWIDDKGMKQLSDQPPPPSVPLNRILRQPRTAPPALVPAAAGNPAASAATPAADSARAAGDDQTTRPPTLAERNADYNKRKAEAAEAGQKAAQEAAQKSAAAANCDNARSNQMALESGIRMSTFDKDGQRSFLTDEQRAERIRQNKAALAGCAR